MVIKRLTVLPRAYTIEQNGTGTVNVWLCRQIKTYITVDGIREFDIDIRVMRNVEQTPETEADVRRRFEMWWESAGLAQA
ncbi:MAG: hypothetical protein RSE23_01885 [Clostridia bacterium]